MKRIGFGLSISIIVCVCLIASTSQVFAAAQFTVPLRLGMSGPSVVTLQRTLKSYGFYTYPTITGYFGPVTQRAVILFQQKYASEVLVPAHLSYGTGYVGSLTLKKLNALTMQVNPGCSNGSLYNTTTGAPCQPLPPTPIPNPILNPSCTPAYITSPLNFSGTPGSFFSYSIFANGNPTSYAATNLPPGLSFSNQTISGIPTVSGIYSAVITASSTCSKDTRNLLISIAAVGAPTLNFFVSSSTISSGTSAALSWSTTNATSCTASDGWSGTKSISGSESTGILTADKNFVLTCTGPGGTVARSSAVTMRQAIVQPPMPQPAPVVTFSISSTTAVMGTSIALTWSATNAISCAANGSWSGPKAVSGTESVLVSTANPNYQLSCTGTGGSASQMIILTVTPAPLQITTPFNIDNKIAGLTGSPANTSLLTSEDDANSIYVWNTNNWLYGIDMTMISPWNSLGNRQEAGVLVSPRHLIQAHHFTYGGGVGGGVGAVVRFIKQDGTVVERTVVGSVQVGTTDIQVEVLDSDVPPGIGFAKVLPANYATYLPTISSSSPIPAVGIFGGGWTDTNAHPNKTATVRELSSLLGAYAVYQKSTSPTRASFYIDDIISHDSGNPAFLLINNQLVLINCWTIGLGGAGPSIADYTSAVNAAITSLGNNPNNYQLTPIDLTSTTSF